MTKINFTLSQREELIKNKYVNDVTSNVIKYTSEFKQHCISEYEEGKSSIQIFKEAGFDMNVIGNERAKSSLKNWRKIFKEKGEIGLLNNHKIKTARSFKKKLSLEEQVNKQKAEIEYLKSELQFVKKLDMIERRALAKTKKNTKK